MLLLSSIYEEMLGFACWFHSTFASIVWIWSLVSLLFLQGVVNTFCTILIYNSYMAINFNHPKEYVLYNCYHHVDKLIPLDPIQGTLHGKIYLHPLNVSLPTYSLLLVLFIMNDILRTFNWNQFCQLVIFLIIVSRKNGNIVKCFINICRKTKISHLASRGNFMALKSPRHQPHTSYQSESFNCIDFTQKVKR